MDNAFTFAVHATGVSQRIVEQIASLGDGRVQRGIAGRIWPGRRFSRAVSRTVRLLLVFSATVHFGCV